MALPNYFLTALAQTLTVGGNDSQIELSTIFTQDGQIVTTADFAQYGRGILTINPLSLSGVEFASFTIVDPTLGSNGGVKGVLRGLSFKGNNQIPTNQKFNVIGTPVIISFGTHNLLDIPALAGANIFTGTNDFTGATITGPAPILDSQLTTKLYVDTAISSGGVPATPTVLGISKISVSAVNPAQPIAVGDNDPRVPTQGENDALVGTSGTPSSSNKYVTNDDTASAATASKVARRLAGGNITVVTESQANNSTNAASTAYVDTGLTATAVAFNNVIATRAGNTAAGTQTIAHGLGKTPRLVKIYATFLVPQSTSGTANAVAVSSGAYNGTNTNCIWYSTLGSNSTSTSQGTDGSHIIYLQDNGTGGGSLGQQATIAVDSTNITLTWTVINSSVFGSSNNIQLQIVVEG